MKKKYLVFSKSGAKIVKGEKPVGGIEYPHRVPTNIPMEFWKLENGIIVEMTQAEQEVSKSRVTRDNSKSALKLLEKDIFNVKDYSQIILISTIIAIVFHIIMKLL